MKKFSSFNQFQDAVIITNSLGEAVFRNNSFKRLFKNFTELKKFSHNMNFDICPLNSENIEVYSPIYHALSSKENFFALVSYEFAQNKIRYFYLTAVKKHKYTAIFLTDVTAENTVEDLKTQIFEMNNKYKKLEEENDELQKIRAKAQSQAIRIALINKMSNIIRESMDISKILNSALYELAMMFGAFKAYYATNKDGGFKIEEIYGGKDKSFVKFDENTNKQILSGEISTTRCLL